jgi:hypothetical protein
MSDSDLRHALIGTWRLISCQTNTNGTPVKPFGENPQGYVVYTPDNHVVIQFAARERPDFFVPLAQSPVPALLESTGHRASTALGFSGYCGTFEVLDGQVVHHLEFGVLPEMSGQHWPRSVVLDGDRLVLGTARGLQYEWQRVH